MLPGEKIQILDHGFVQLVDKMGDDQAIVDAARLSVAGENVKTTQDNFGLIRYLLRNRHCYTPEMEVLTATGWKRWDECETIETFLVPDPKTRRYLVETLQPEVFDADETLCCFKSNRMSYRVTPDHRMYFKGKYQDDFEIVRAHEMKQWGHFDPSRGYSLSARAPVDDTSPDYLEWALIGFYLGDGSHASTNRVSFHLRKEHKKVFLADLLKKLDIEHTKAASATYEDAEVYYVHTPEFLRSALAEHLTARASTKSLACVNLCDLTMLQLKGLYDGLVNSDGHFNEERKRIEFSSASPHLLKTFEAVSVLLGFTATKSKRRVHTHLNNRTTLEARKQYFYTEHYEGKVYCATTSTGLLMVRGGPDSFGFVCGNTTPFEMVEFKFRCKMPIFVARQWVRHRTASLNEMSARYSELPAEFYVPETKDIKYQATQNKQGRGNEEMDFASEHQNRFGVEADLAFVNYKERLGDGMARELARNNLPLSTYTMWIWKIDLHNLFHFLGLRAHSHAQMEIRVFAEAMCKMIQPYVPIAYEAFEDFRLNASFLTAQDMMAIKHILANHAQQFDADTEGVKEIFKTKREYTEFSAKWEDILR